VIATAGRVILCLWLVAGTAAAQPPPPALDCGQIETFLKKARIGRQRALPVGVTLPSRATLDDGRLQHDAAIQTVDASSASHPTAQGGTELNFRDSWQFNVAGYELARMLGLNMVPPYVERIVGGVRASLSWMVPGVMMERDRVLKDLAPPDVERWNAQVLAARAFRELIADTDGNMTNLLITKDWRVWIIDFTRAFRTATTLHEPGRLTAMDRRLLAAMKALSRDEMRKRLDRWLDRGRIDAVLARRDLIVRLVDGHVSAKGEAAVLYDLDRTLEPCGTGLM
jgi:hypothetical protein